MALASQSGLGLGLGLGLGFEFGLGELALDRGHLLNIVPLHLDRRLVRHTHPVVKEAGGAVTSGMLKEKAYKGSLGPHLVVLLCHAAQFPSQFPRFLRLGLT